MASTPGLLYVTMQPHETLPPAQFHDWYNNEHGPVRLRLSFVTNGFRYRARGDARPAWLAIYDITDVTELTRAPYTTLREPDHKTARETSTMKQIDMDRRIYDRVEVHQARAIPSEEGGSVLVGRAIQVASADEAGLEHWYAADHLPRLQKTTGWLRSRRFRTAAADVEHAVEYLLLDEFESGAAESLEHAALGGVKATQTRGPFAWDLAYTFGPAPRELGALWDPATTAFMSLDETTRTFPVPASPAIESYVRTADGVELAYRLEGAGAAAAPVVVLVNSVLVSWQIWDDFATAFGADPAHQQYRLLRYNARGRSATAGSHVSLDALAADLMTLLDALRIERVAVAIGVSLGGATVLNAALTHPRRIPAFIACDTNDAAPASNVQAWSERIAVAERESAHENGQPVVGAELAEQTIRRWFAASSFDGGEQEARAQGVKEQVRTNSLEGFKTCVQALYSYDLRPRMGSGSARGLFVVGAEDGVLPQTMKDMADRYGGPAAPLDVIEHAGHLPMVEQPAAFTHTVGRFLRHT